jgi:hypothetical protein
MTLLKDNRILQKMLDRLFATLVNGPSLNARPHSSRQRIDFTQLAKFRDRSLEEILRDLLAENREAKVVARVPIPKLRRRQNGSEGNGSEPEAITDEERAAEQAYSEQQTVLKKCRGIVEDSRAYQNDTGVHVLQIGFPVLSLPPGSFGKRNITRRVLAPICFISLEMSVKTGPTPSIALECKNDGADMVVPNIALLAWLEAQAGREIGELDADEEGERPWDEIAHVVERVSQMLEIGVPPEFASGQAAQSALSLRACPRADDADNQPRIVSSAVVGLFPSVNQGLIRDTQAMLAGEPVSGPIETFINIGASLDEGSRSDGQPVDDTVEKRVREFSDERLISPSDPCQTRAVKLARTSKGLVVHGPPGTGKSQTIANVLGDHLARGERVLFVCDKRTALDVVMNRLDSMGLGDLCAVVHDPQRDQRELYKAIRQQLEDLPDLRTNAAAEGALARIDSELQRLHAEMTEYHTALMDGTKSNCCSFHDLMGHWLTLPAHEVEFKDTMLAGITPASLESETLALQELFERGNRCAFPTNPWVAAAGMRLSDFLSRQMDDVRALIQGCVDKGRVLDASAHNAIPPFTATDELAETGQARASLGERLKRWIGRDLPTLKKWLSAEAITARQQSKRLEELSNQTKLIEEGPLESELFAAVRESLPAIPAMNQQISCLNGYLKAVGGFLGFLAFGKKKAAAQVLGPYGLQLSPENATRVRDFLERLKARVLTKDLLGQLSGDARTSGLPADEVMLSGVSDYRDALSIRLAIEDTPQLKPLREAVANAASSSELLGVLIEGSARSAVRAQRIADFETTLQAAKLFSPRWVKAAQQHIRSGKLVSPHVTTLQERLATLENVLRVRETLTKLPEALRQSAEHLLGKSVSPEIGLTILKKSALSNEITSRLRSDPRLQAADRHRLQSSFERYISLDGQKKAAVRATILHLWGTRQKDRLLAMTGSRLNGTGADLRRRLTLRGERAMRLRQVIAVGQTLTDGDPLFDMRPVWMASPETVAQVFPRKPLFDVIVFDEASQCRLEEALPVLLRGHRVVIAGDPKQLPPTRFFESAIVTSEDEEVETDQQLFEVQQGEIEDLLGAALNIEIEECYLDVHYRSRNSDLIQFSNAHFYGSRLQAIPGHPANRSRFAPLTAYKVNGVYKDRQNEPEAEKVCQIVRDLLRRAEPPSIGIACFNITQRDLILDKLEELAESDPAFGKALAQAWTRRGPAQFEGLFVKNLENVQGDERDHIIISTTYGPDPSGKFYHRFGPLGRSGGGRRLNVLVTRARQEIHLVTSIPESEYRSLPPVPAGQTPGGPYLLFSYIAYAEQLAELYEQAHAGLAEAEVDHQPLFREAPTRYPSEFCVALGKRLVESCKTGAEVYWGNDGFCVDLALQHPKRAEDVTIGVLCDTNRFGLAADPVEWEVFRTAILESQGWKLHRLWTPHFFRDMRGSIDAVLTDVQSFLAADTDKDAIRVSDGDELSGMV